MNKYKVGDKFIVEVEGVRKNAFPYIMKLKKGKYANWEAEEAFLDQLQPFECELTMTAEEVWELAKQIMFKSEFSATNLEEIFGTRNHFAIMRDFTPQEVKAMIDEWKKRKEEIKVGDVLQTDGGMYRCVVTQKGDDGIMVLYDDGDFDGVCFEEIGRDYKNTGEHIKLEKLFSKIKGE